MAQPDFFGIEDSSPKNAFSIVIASDDTHAPSNFSSSSEEKLPAATTQYAGSSLARSIARSVIPKQLPTVQSRRQIEQHSSSDAQKSPTIKRSARGMTVAHQEASPLRAGQYSEQNAWDVVKELRREQALEMEAAMAKRDRDGSLAALHKLWSQIPNINAMTREELLTLLMRCVLLNEDDLVVINKPFGLASHGGPGVRISLAHALHPLAARLQCHQLYMCHRLDAGTTGCLMLAKTAQKCAQIKSLFAERRVIKRYWCITRGVPDPPDAIIKIPLVRANAGGRYKTVLCPLRSPDPVFKLPHRKERSQAVEAVTDYKTLRRTHSMALVECTTHTGVQHQVRAHLGFGISRPIMGDHKYSDYLRYLPQRLPADVLHQLGIRSAKSRCLPIYLHAKEIQITNYADGRNFVVRAPLPQFFMFTMRLLKLKL